MKIKIEKVPLPTIGCRIYVVIAKDIHNAIKKVIGNNEGVSPAAIAVTCHEGPHSYVFFKPNASAGEVAHEMWHALRRQFKRIGAKLENELFAYHLEYMVDETVAILRKWAKKVK